MSRDGKLVASSSLDETVRVWSTVEGRCKHLFEGHSGGVSSYFFVYVKHAEVSFQVLCCCISRDKEFVASGAMDFCIFIWSLTSGAYLRKLEGHTDAASSVLLNNI